ncbi:von Willebrand factor type A domain protein [Anatilimnocola aggregata]|uniref:von Willebrand factor type A domain protein n=1 Tax=Anatilimnocola aggregata TaxID=2528021 RepID=A0A517Y522_9BACT|nr:VWA domain-containing protein [Anatilimnocola aggregata]QDU25325.1 von Willebrand factor type A domain protein [Anatilimnocola aggregata]
MDHVPDDSRLDDLLRDIAVPQELAARLKEIAIPTDDELDQLVCGLAVPEELSLRLHAIPEDDLLDEELQEVDAPLTLRGQLQLPTPADRWRNVQRWAARLTVAAALFLAVSATLFTSGAAYLTSIYPPAVEPQWVVLAQAPGTWDGSLIPAPDESDEGVTWLPHQESLPSMAMTVEPAESDTTLMGEVDPSLFLTSSGPVGQLQSLLRSGMRPWDDVVLMKYGLLGAPQYSEDELPELIRVQLPARSGIEPPLVREFDRRFLLREGIFPPVSPGRNPKLQQLEIPLSTANSSVELAEAALANGKLPNADEIRVEQFVAALESRLPPAPRGRLDLVINGSPSPFGPPDAKLLHIGVQAGKLKRQSKQPTHLVVAIDISASMARGNRLEMVRHALNQMQGQMTGRDALSIVAFEEDIVCRTEHLTASQGEELRQQLLELNPRGGTNLAAGLQTAASVALTEPPLMNVGSYRQRLVLITDSRAAMPDDTAEKITEVMTLIGAEGVGFDVLDVSGRSEPDPLLSQLTQELAGTYRAISSRQQLYASLVESLAGHSPAVALEAQLRIRFNPQTVGAYRLLGHEPNLLAAVVPAAVDAQLLPEEAAGALLELWLTGHSSTNLGEAIITWKDPQTSQRQQKKLPLTRNHIASSFGETPASLQTAAVAAEIAEQLRGSREALRRENLLPTQQRNTAATIRTTIRPWSLTLRQEPDLNRLLTLLDRMEKIRGR